MGNDSNKSQSPKLIETVRFDVLAVIAGVISISLIFQNQIFACIFGIVGIVSFVLSVRFDEYGGKIERYFAFLGLVLSALSVLFVLITLMRNKLLVS